MPPVHQFIVDLASHPPNKIEGDAVYLTGNKNVVPVALAKNVRHNKVIHSRTILLNFQVEDIPRVPSLKKIQTEKLAGGFHRIVAHYGFMEDPSLNLVFIGARPGFGSGSENQQVFMSAVKTWSSLQHPP
jgi:KUP system potassium uptake protein